MLPLSYDKSHVMYIDIYKKCIALSNYCKTFNKGFNNNNHVKTTRIISNKCPEKFSVIALI